MQIRDGLDDASGQVSLTYSEIKVVDKATSLVLDRDPGPAETGIASFIATGAMAEEAGYLVQNDSVHMTEEAAVVGPETMEEAGSIEAVSETSGGQVSSVQLQTVIKQVPQNKSRKSKKNKSPQSPKSPSEKCKQQ